MNLSNKIQLFQISDQTRLIDNVGVELGSQEPEDIHSRLNFLPPLLNKFLIKYLVFSSKPSPIVDPFAD